MPEFVILVGGLFLAAGFVWPLLVQPTNCGGNSAALSNVGMICLSMRIAASENSDTFEVDRLEPIWRDELARRARNHWTREAPYLIRRKPVCFDETNRAIVAVCAGRFDNVPRPSLWNLYRRNPAYAVAFGDGSSGLLTEAGFQQLDLKDFVDLRTLVALSEQP